MLLIAHKHLGAGDRFAPIPIVYCHVACRLSPFTHAIRALEGLSDCALGPKCKEVGINAPVSQAVLCRLLTFARELAAHDRAAHRR